jgi:mono/diheme cytochrome c family protein
MTILPYWGISPSVAQSLSAAPFEGISTATQTADMSSSPGATSEPVDGPAQLFMTKCASCHTIGGGRIGDAPDLIASTRWPRADLKIAIDRMQKNVGPLDPQEIDQLTDLIQSEELRQRLDAARESIARRRTAQLTPPSPATGGALFHGRRLLAQGGMACAACHAVDGRGGSLAVDLTDVFARMGATALTASIESINFPVMKEAYARRPVTAQEAADLTAYLETAATTPPGSHPAPPSAAGPPFGWIGLLLGLGAVAGLGWHQRGHDRAGTRARLVQESKRSLHP